MIITFIIQSVLWLINIILIPIDALINSVIPSVLPALANIGSYLTLVASYIGWAVSASGLSLLTITLIVAYYTFILTIPFTVWIMKLVVNWWHVLKP